MEIWKSIPGFSKYEASSLGNLRSLNYKRTGKVKVLSPSQSPDGYLKTMLLDDDGKYRSWTVHLFVCMAFFGNKKTGFEVNHINGIKTDNSIENLEYCTRSENMKHAFNLGLELPLNGSKNGNSKLSESDVIAIREHASNFKGRYYGRKQLAEKYGVSEAHIKDIVAKRRGIWNCV